MLSSGKSRLSRHTDGPLCRLRTVGGQSVCRGSLCWWRELVAWGCRRPEDMLGSGVRLCMAKKEGKDVGMKASGR
jgi:hypothetical protein